MNKALATAALAAVVLTGCSTGHQTQGATDPVATSIVTRGASYVTLAMGDPSNPLDTFWQLLVRPAGSPRWANQVTSTGVATNGGIVLATNGRSVLAAARPSNLLRFTPLIVTSDAGRSWRPDGLVPVSVSADPDSVAAGPLGILAIGPSGADVLRQAAGSKSWTTQVTLAQLDHSVRACDPVRITAVAFDHDKPVVGAACRKNGTSGIVVPVGPSWKASGPTVANGEQSTVLGLRVTDSGLTALLEVIGRRGTELVAAYESGGRWATGPGLNLDGQLLSYGPASGNGWFALTRPPSGGLRLSATSLTGPVSFPAGAAGTPGWQELLTPPPGAATAAFGAADPGTVDAFTVDSTGTLLTVWELPPGATRWTVTQTLRVPIQSGSSS